MEIVSVNYWAVVVGLVISMVLGFVWYSPVLFANAWVKEIGKKVEDMKGNGTGYLVTAIAALVLSYVMAHIVHYTGATTFATGLQTGFWTWLGFVAATGISRTIFSGQSIKLFAIDYGYNLVQFLLLGVLFALWK